MILLRMLRRVTDQAPLRPRVDFETLQISQVTSFTYDTLTQTLNLTTQSQLISITGVLKMDVMTE